MYVVFELPVLVCDYLFTRMGALPNSSTMDQLPVSIRNTRIEKLLGILTSRSLIFIY